MTTNLKVGDVLYTGDGWYEGLRKHTIIRETKTQWVTELARIRKENLLVVGDSTWNRTYARPATPELDEQLAAQECVHCIRKLLFDIDKVLDNRARRSKLSVPQLSAMQDKANELVDILKQRSEQ